MNCVKESRVNLNCTVLYGGAEALKIMRMIRFAGIRGSEKNDEEKREDPPNTRHTNYYDCICKTEKHATEGKSETECPPAGNKRK